MKKLKRGCLRCGHSRYQHNTFKGEESICLVDLESNPAKPERFCRCIEFVTKKMMRDEKFKPFYILGDGWWLPYHDSNQRIWAGLQTKSGSKVLLKMPSLDSGDPDCPRYRLVLERI